MLNSGLGTNLYMAGTPHRETEMTETKTTGEIRLVRHRSAGQMGSPNREPEDTRTVAEIIRDDEKSTSAQRGANARNRSLIAPVVIILTLAICLVVAWIAT
jgi:hypothetical protein